MNIKTMVHSYYAGDKNARDTVFAYVWSVARLLGVCHVRGTDEADSLAIDITASAMELLDAQRFDPERGSLLNWVMMVAGPVARKYCAELHRERHLFSSRLQDVSEVDHAEYAADPAEQASQEQQLARLNEAVWNLPNENWSRVLKLQYNEGLSHEQIAERLGTTVATVKAWRARGVAALREQWAAAA